jgi:hypothetical protein
MDNLSKKQEFPAESTQPSSLPKDANIIKNELLGLHTKRKTTVRYSSLKGRANYISYLYLISF